MRKEPSALDLTRDEEGMKEKLELARLGSHLEKPQHSRSSVCLLYRANRCSYCGVQQYYCKRINKGAGLIVHSWARKIVSVGLSRSSLHRGAAFRP